ncbi:hypothetical protein ACO0K3_02765 [Undibacterium sp. Rencai35W]|uniref:hypothetical protein n=1 Tax=Undibacterium sp. Rencai35W TaxID=3413046 RepID=UPI003BF18DB2
MLATHLIDRHSQSSFAAPGQTFWSTVDFALSVPYFLISYEAQEEPVLAGYTKLMWEVGDVIRLCDEIAQHPLTTLRQVAMICPERLSRSSGWQMFNLAKIDLVKLRSSAKSSYLFTTTDGKQLFNHKTRADLKNFDVEYTLLRVTA